MNMTFTDKQKGDIEALSALSYTLAEIALYLDVPVKTINREYNDQNSEFRYHYERGKLSAKLKIDRANYELAKTGDKFATIRYDRKEKEARAQEARSRIFRGS
jgi:hypothetical protein